MSVDVQFSHPWGQPYTDKEYNVGDRASLDEDTARRLVNAGTAVPATVPDAKAVGVDKEAAATVKSKSN